MKPENNALAVDEEEYEVAMEEAKNSQDTYVHEFSTPFTFEGEKFETLHFDFGSLTGNDSLAIENEMTSLGMATVVPEFSGEYLIRLAMRACTDRRADGRKLGVDAFKALPLAAFVRIRGRARAFLLRVG